MYQYTGYIARVRDPSSSGNVHAMTDLLHVVAVFDKKENFDYRDLKRVVEQDNKLVLYATRIDRSIRDKFTWEKTLEELARHPPSGDVCVTFHDHPITFGEFVEIGYGRGILSDKTGYQYFRDRVPSTDLGNSAQQLASDHKVDEVVLDHSGGMIIEIEDEEVGNMGETATTVGGKRDLLTEAVNKGIGDSINFSIEGTSKEGPLVSSSLSQLTAASSFFDLDPALAINTGASEVVNDKKGEETYLSMEYWKGRALRSEGAVTSLEEQIEKKDDTIYSLKSKLASSEDAKVRFAATADLAAIRVKEFRSDSSSSIVEGLKPQLDNFPKMFSLLKEVSGKLDALGEVPQMVKSVKDISDKVATKLEAEMDEVPKEANDDMEGVLCFMEKLGHLCDRFGFTPSSDAVNIPEAVLSLLSPRLDLSAHQVTVSAKKSSSVAVGSDIPLFSPGKLFSSAKSTLPVRVPENRRSRFSKPSWQDGVGPTNHAIKREHGFLLNQRNNNTGVAPPKPGTSNLHKQTVPQLKRSPKHLDTDQRPAGWPWNSEEIKFKFSGDGAKRSRF